MDILIQDFESSIENNQIFLAEKLQETGLKIVECNTICDCERCGKGKTSDRFFHLFGYYNKRYIDIFAHYLCILDFLKRIEELEKK